jgi:hypothetical protein
MPVHSTHVVRPVTGWLDNGAEEWHGRPVVHKIGDVVPRHRAVLTGVVRRARVRRVAAPGPRARRSAGGVEFDAVLDDGTGEILLRWVGREAVAGVVAGAGLHVEGTVGEWAGIPVILNPLYSFDPEGSSATSTSW